MSVLAFGSQQTVPGVIIWLDPKLDSFGPNGHCECRRSSFNFVRQLVRQ